MNAPIKNLKLCIVLLRQICLSISHQKHRKIRNFGVKCSKIVFPRDTKISRSWLPEGLSSTFVRKNLRDFPLSHVEIIEEPEVFFAIAVLQGYQGCFYEKLDDCRWSAFTAEYGSWRK